LSVQDDEDSSGAHVEDADVHSDVVHEVIRNDELRRLERAERTSAESAILLAAKMIAPRISASYEDGYEWCIEQVHSGFACRHFEKVKFSHTRYRALDAVNPQATLSHPSGGCRYFPPGLQLPP